MEIKTVFLDIDGTIMDFDASSEVALRTLFSRFGYPYSKEVFLRYREINLRLWEEHERGRIERDKILTRRFDELFAMLGIDQTGEVFEKPFREELAKDVIFIKDALPTLEYLSRRYDVYFVTNGVSTTQRRRVQLANIERFIKFVFVSDEIGLPKPEKGFFDYCFQRIAGATPETTFIVGDSLTADICGGIGAGIHTCWFNPEHRENNSGIVPEFEIEELATLRTIL